MRSHHACARPDLRLYLPTHRSAPHPRQSHHIAELLKFQCQHGASAHYRHHDQQDHDDCGWCGRSHTATEDITAFVAGTDSSSLFGLVEPGASVAVTTSSLAGNYFFGDEQARDETVVSRVGVIKISNSGGVTGTEDDSGTSGLQTKAVNGTIAIDNANGPGTGNVGTSTFAITNGTRLFFFEETGPATITVVEHQ
jgi:hypothetical protein